MNVKSNRGMPQIYSQECLILFKEGPWRPYWNREWNNGFGRTIWQQERTLALCIMLRVTLSFRWATNIVPYSQEQDMQDSHLWTFRSEITWHLPLSAWWRHELASYVLFHPTMSFAMNYRKGTLLALAKATCWWICNISPFCCKDYQVFWRVPSISLFQCPSPVSAMTSVQQEQRCITHNPSWIMIKPEFYCTNGRVQVLFF